MRVLVTGHRGYLGSVMTAVLTRARFDVVGLDCNLYEGCDFGCTQESIPSFDIDLRSVEFTDLLSFDAVVHLAELPQDGAQQLDPALIHEVNHDATIHLARCCVESGVSRFVFASSCSVYGRGDHESLDESSPPRPLTAYASSKLRAERDLAQLADSRPGGFTPVFLRNATPYGVSPRLRLDLTLNDLVSSAAATGCVMVPSIGTAWQPLIHIEDLARVYAAVLLAPDEAVRNEVFNVARRNENHRTIDVANAITDLLPDCRQFIARDTFETQSRRVDGSKLHEAFPQLPLRWTMLDGIRQLYSAMRNAGLTPAQWRSARYRRAAHLAKLIHTGAYGEAHDPTDQSTPPLDSETLGGNPITQAPRPVPA